MTTSGLQLFAKVRAKKSEFQGLGRAAWWMHEACMTEDDLKGYYMTDGQADEAKYAWE